MRITFVIIFAPSTVISSRLRSVKRISGGFLKKLRLQIAAFFIYIWCDLHTHQMTINEERDIIINALYHDFGKGHRINSERLKDHIVSTYQMSDVRFYAVLDDLHSNGYVERILFAQVQEFYITIKGEEIIDEYGGFASKARKEKQATFQFNNSPITGSQIGNQGRDFLLEDNTANRNTDTDSDIALRIKNIPNDKSAGWLKKFLTLHQKDIKLIFVTIISGIIISFITWHINRYLDNKNQVKIPPKSTTTTVKKL